MKIYLCNVLIFLCLFANLNALTISSNDAVIIGEKIWRNECGGTIEGLTSWKKGENFPSMGIGHFIWYPANTKERFQETFPDLLLFLQKEGIALPTWLQSRSAACPWNSREEFYADIQSPKMKGLRQLLYETRNLQAIFIANRLERALPRILESCSEMDKNKVAKIFNQLAQDPNGLYAMIDYVNFKGEGILPEEGYQGKGWGLLQVLQGMPIDSRNPVQEFAESAKVVLTQRVHNSPPERHEGKWLKGWMNRLDTYATNNHNTKMEQKEKPAFLYKVLSRADWIKSQKQEFIVLDKMDDKFIHLATDEQLPRIIEKFWSTAPDYVVLKLDTNKLQGNLVFEANPGGTNKYYHLYNGTIPTKAVVEVKVK